MTYFSQIPNLQVLNRTTNNTATDETVIVKNLFKRAKIREDIASISGAFEFYSITENERPDDVAEKIYGDPELDWVILITAGIINVKNEWPLDNKQLYDYSLEKYGFDNLNSPRHYETTLVVDGNNRLVLPPNLIVDQNFTITDPTDPLGTLNPVVPISNYQYEVKKNNDKRQIYVLKKDYLGQFLNDTRQLMLYTDSSEYVNDLLIRTENTEVKLPR